MTRRPHLWKRAGKGADDAVIAEPELLVGLDIGASKVVVVVAERDGTSGEAQIIGIGQALSRGIGKALLSISAGGAVRTSCR
jgi:cell division protein FtsA